jgi:hypothetical protein
MLDGSTTLAFRRWTRPQVVAGRPYRTIAGRIQVDAVDEVEVSGSSVTEAEARAAGHASVAELLGELRPATGGRRLYRVRFHLLDEPDPRARLAATDDLDAAAVAELDRRLERLDRARPGVAPWTTRVLDLIAAHPARRAGDLAPMLGRDLLSFKLDVRKLKALGLTESLDVGYRLSPRGRRYRELTTRRS